MKITVDLTKCIGAGQCVLAASSVFDQRDDDGVVIVLDDNPPADAYADVRRAAELCPSHVITVNE